MVVTGKGELLKHKREVFFNLLQFVLRVWLVNFGVANINPCELDVLTTMLLGEFNTMSARCKPFMQFSTPSLKMKCAFGLNPKSAYLQAH
ncbi:hypothetical protein MTR_1g027940 [Medicago truncatula]|uniref:Uncharacterized protein n=1 Tax=Medicago truncatula TaxID=3880 RepID=A0A072VQI7_MEDTR|nr:hypothetical protein MTR_1g027940 [Medicago truncatula]